MPTYTVMEYLEQQDGQGFRELGRRTITAPNARRAAVIADAEEPRPFAHIVETHDSAFIERTHDQPGWLHIIEAEPAEAPL